MQIKLPLVAGEWSLMDAVEDGWAPRYQGAITHKMTFRDKNNHEIERFSSYIKPKLFPYISLRTVKFLHIHQNDIDGGIEYLDFYSKLKDIEIKYRPMVFVWGKNDQLELNKLNKMYKLRNFTKSMQFVDLLIRPGK